MSFADKRVSALVRVHQVESAIDVLESAGAQHVVMTSVRATAGPGDDRNLVPRVLIEALMSGDQAEAARAGLVALLGVDEANGWVALADAQADYQG